MADLTKISLTTMALADQLDDDIEPGHEVTDVLLIVHTRNEEGSESLHSRCSSPSHLVQRGIAGWATQLIELSACPTIYEDEEEE